ncbi:DinB family protein [Burkholderia ubonensis]|uniref:DinB family protein n=1 Tax=Burkholderia ubonensis TaxID=101571 RepID=UPI0009B48776|nr:DinB family protein [Burkholderia ubonensis]
MLVRYKSWANGLTFKSVMDLPAGEALRQRPTRFGNMVHTLNHVYVVDDIFRHHLQGKKHTYTSRNTDHTPAVSDHQVPFAPPSNDLPVFIRSHYRDAR